MVFTTLSITTGRDRTSRALGSFPLCTSIVARPMSVVFGLGTRLRVRMRTKFEKVPVRYRPNAASGGWSYGRDLVSLP